MPGHFTMKCEGLLLYHRGVDVDSKDWLLAWTSLSPLCHLILQLLWTSIVSFQISASSGLLDVGMLREIHLNLSLKTDTCEIFHSYSCSVSLNIILQLDMCWRTCSRVYSLTYWSNGSTAETKMYFWRADQPVLCLLSSQSRLTHLCLQRVCMAWPRAGGGDPNAAAPLSVSAGQRSCLPAAPVLWW